MRNCKRNRKRRSAEERKARRESSVRFRKFQVDLAYRGDGDMALTLDEIARLPVRVQEQRESERAWLEAEAEASMAPDFPPQGSRRYERRMQLFTSRLYAFVKMELLYRARVSDMFDDDEDVDESPKLAGVQEYDVPDYTATEQLELI